MLEQRRRRLLERFVDGAAMVLIGRLSMSERAKATDAFPGH